MWIYTDNNNNNKSAATTALINTPLFNHKAAESAKNADGSLDKPLSALFSGQKMREKMS